nr:hypothetical protein CFP56_07266 [Quercus suber]
MACPSRLEATNGCHALTADVLPRRPQLSVRTLWFGLLPAMVSIPLVMLIDYYLHQKDYLSLTVLTLADVSICGMAFGLYRFLTKSNTCCERQLTMQFLRYTTFGEGRRPNQWFVRVVSLTVKILFTPFGAALFLGAAGLGVIIRDSAGNVIGALAERIPLLSSVTTVEALACRRAVLFALELSAFDATFEGHVVIVSNALLEGGSNHPEFGLVINDSLRLASGFRFYVESRSVLPLPLGTI